jgi:hypothetical protein
VRRRGRSTALRYPADDMADIAINNQPLEPRKRQSSLSIFLPPLLFLGAMFIAADFTPIALRPLKVLQIPYPGWMDYSHFLIPAACAIVWLASIWKWPNAGAIVAVLLCFTLVPLISRYAESRVAKVPVTRWIDSNDLELIEGAIGALVTEQGSREGTFVIVAPSDEQRVRAELARLKLLGAQAAE